MIAFLQQKLFQLALLATLTCTLSACGGGGSGSGTTQSDTANINNNTSNNTVPPTQNRDPIANAGIDFSISEQQTVTLVGNGLDPDGDTLSFIWQQVSGPVVTISNANNQNASFLAPPTDVEVTLEFRLTVIDNNAGSSSDNILIQITNDELPIANAGEDQTIDEQSPGILDGVASNDPDGGSLNYLWTQVSGVEVRLDNSASSQATFTAPAISQLSELIFQLTVTDEIGNSAIDTVNVTVNALPVGAIPLDANRFLSFINQSSPLFQETEETAQAYYTAIDPQGLKQSLQSWMSSNGFDQGSDARTVYRNAADLGFGRVMSMRTNADGSSAAFVENYLTLDEAVTAVVTGDRSGLLATVAMEYSAHPDDPNGVMYTKFYTFGANDERITKIDLDGRGEKFQPGLCVVCHGGRPKSLVNAVYPDNGDTGAHFLPWDLDTFEYSDNPLYTRNVQESEFKKLNQAVLKTYPKILTEIPGQWTGNASRETIQGWYGDDTNLPAATFNGGFVPIGWRTPTNGGPINNPSDVEDLYLKVVGPNCRACHIQRGRKVENNMQGELIDFTTYAKFYDYKDQIIELIFDQGKMPSAKVTFNNFWSENDGEVAAEILGVHLGVNSLVRRPGRPIANPGLSRQAPIGNVQLSGEASLFAQTFNWSFTDNGKPANSNAILANNTTEKPTLITDVPGAYRVQLVVNNGLIDSEPVTTTIVALNGISPITFSGDIVPIFTNDCQSCHSIGLAASVTGIPVRFDDSSTLYPNIVTYINFEDISASPILTKATGQQHGAGVLAREGFDLSAGSANQSNYNKFIAWISEGAENN
ncbi:MAG: hypothetical protein AB8B89_05365 [Gammaproteobacteria bacterium]